MHGEEIKSSNKINSLLGRHGVNMEVTLRAFHRVEADESHTVAVEITGLPSLEWSRHMAHWLHLIKERAHEIGCGLASDRSCVRSLAHIASAVVALA
jgi:hypothetical protein